MKGTWLILLECSDIYFVGGFGTVQWVDVKEYDRARPDIIAVNGAENTLKVCFVIFWYILLCSSFW